LLDLSTDKASHAAETASPFWQVVVGSDVAKQCPSQNTHPGPNIICYHKICR
jgi:hypothetical protein